MYYVRASLYAIQMASEQRLSVSGWARAVLGLGNDVGCVRLQPSPGGVVYHTV